ncbi:MAG: hypothetical protein KKG84_05665 [Candidatus Omnitrophica bacterium]|nr:hypothetical protein [Candidatus Omnitrophota bacterium]
MKTLATLLITATLLFTATACFAEDDTDGRYELYVIEVNNKNEPILLDTETGKMWRYEAGGTFGKNEMFKGITVEGLAYSAEKKEDMDKQISEWASKQLIDPNVQGYKDAMANEFSYSLDLKRARALNFKMKASSAQGTDQ